MFSKLLSRTVVLRKLKGRFDALFSMGSSQNVAGREVTLVDSFGFSGLTMRGVMLAILVALSLMAFGALFNSIEAGVLLAVPTITTTRDLKSILKRMTEIQTEYKGKTMPENIGSEWDGLAAEADVLQKEADRAETIRKTEELEKKGRTLATPSATPAASQPDPDEFKSEKPAGLISLGDFVAFGEGLKQFITNGAPKAHAVLATLEGMKSRVLWRDRGRKGMPYIPLNREERKAIQAITESKSVPVIGAGVIEPDRMAEIVRVTEHDRLRLRDVLNTATTTKDAVSYTRLVSVTRAAASVAAGEQKPQAAMSLDNVSTPVRTVAVWIPVNNQQIDDFPALSSLINNELLYDLDKHLEELVVYGDGVGENFDGIIPDAAVPDARTEVGDTLIDTARRMITDVRVAGYDPNALLIDPRDWENIVLLKGSDNRYLWVVVTENGVQRLWGVPVVETVAMMDPEDDSRSMLMGDFGRGATLWDRMRSTIAIGWKDDQFIRNQRTILAEFRAAFAVTRPKAFSKHLITGS